MKPNSVDTAFAFDLRLRRAEAVGAAIWREMRHYISDEDRRGAYSALVAILREIGVDMITDADRAAAGLPARGPNGLTDDEMRAVEARRMQAMLRPMGALVVTLSPEERRTG